MAGLELTNLRHLWRWCDIRLWNKDWVYIACFVVVSVHFDYRVEICEIPQKMVGDSGRFGLVTHSVELFSQNLFSPVYLFWNWFLWPSLVLFFSLSSWCSEVETKTKTPWYRASVCTNWSKLDILRTKELSESSSWWLCLIKLNTPVISTGLTFKVSPTLYSCST